MSVEFNGADAVVALSDLVITVPGGRRLVEDASECDPQEIYNAAIAAFKASGWRPQFKRLDAATLASDARAAESVREEYAEAGQWALSNYDEQYDVSREVADGWFRHGPPTEELSELETYLAEQVLGAALEAWPAG